MSYIKAISASMMCADIFKLAEEVHSLKRSGVEYLHIDVMDGVFVPNYALGSDYCRMLREAGVPLDIHLMITEPEYKLNRFAFGEGDIVSVHYEAGSNPHRALQSIKNAGARAFLALNPATPLFVTEDCLPILDGILLMTVNPGFAGQKIVPGAVEKCARVRAFTAAQGYPDMMIECDGNVSFQNAAALSAAGCNIFVAGSSSLFAEGNLCDNAEKLRAAIK